MNPQNLSKVSQVKFHKFLTTFPEFLQLYRMKELLRYDFFHAETKADAKKIASQAYELLQSLGKNNVLGALHTYFKTLNHSNWTPHIYSYFDDPMEQRYSNAKLESLNQLVKDVNRISKGLYWDDLKAKLLYGDLSVKPRPARHPRKKEELTTFHMKCVTDWLDQPRQMAHFPSLSSWEVFFSAPKVRSALTKNGSSLVHFSEQSLTDKVLELRQNNNVPHMVQRCISHLEVSELKCSPKVINRLADDEMHDIEVISPLQFADWTVNKENYLAQIAADCKFLSSANKK